MKHHTTHYIICILAVAILYPSKAHAFDYPNDQPTIEALISLHKLIKKEEEKALEKVAVSYGEQSLVTKGATKFNDVRMTLNSKLNNAYSYVILGAALASTGTDLYRLIDQYATFTKNTAKYAFKKPAVMWYYTEANYACSREIKNIKALYATLTASGLNLMRASMDEKLELVTTSGAASLPWAASTTTTFGTFSTVMSRMRSQRKSLTSGTGRSQRKILNDDRITHM